jgi:hypothetical protein
MKGHQYSRAVESVAGGSYYPDEVCEAFYNAAEGAGKATDGSRLVVVTVEGEPKAALVPLDLVEYALRHGWGR